MDKLFVDVNIVIDLPSFRGLGHHLPSSQPWGILNASFLKGNN